MTDDDDISDAEAFQRAQEEIAHNRNPDNEMSWKMKQAAEYGQKKRAERIGKKAVKRLQHLVDHEFDTEETRELGHCVMNTAPSLTQAEDNRS